MASASEGPPIVPIPERVDRRLRLGPFPSALDAIKFLCYAAAGAVVGEFLDLPAGLLLAGAGFLAAVWRPDGWAWDERALAYLRWKWRAVAPGSLMTEGPAAALVRGDRLEIAPSDPVTVLRTGGIPITYLPPAEIARRFELFRELLRASEGRLAFFATLGSIRSAPYLPSKSDPRAPDTEARAGYSELVDLLCRRRFRRRVYLVVGLGGAGGGAPIPRLETVTASVTQRLVALGLRPSRLKDRGLVDAAREMGWNAGGTAA